MLYANEIRVNMVAFASITDSTRAIARINIMEKPAQVSIIAVMYNKQIIIISCIQGVSHCIVIYFFNFI